jgi:hypothetical protein
MVITDQKIDDLLDALMLKAKDVRTGIPYSKEEQFPQCLTMIGQNFEAATVPALWKDEAEKYHVMRNVSALAKLSFTRLVVLITDVRWTTSPEVAKFLGIPELEEIGVEAWGKQYTRVLTARFGGEVKNLPRQYWHEAVCVVMKGPELKGKIPLRMAHYERGPNDSIHWLPTKSDTDYSGMHFNLLPDWWD